MADSTEAARGLGFRATVPIGTGVADLVARFRRISVTELEMLATGMAIKNWE
jgi:hypothetical protein